MLDHLGLKPCASCARVGLMSCSKMAQDPNLNINLASSTLTLNPEISGEANQNDIILQTTQWVNAF